MRRTAIALIWAVAAGQAMQWASAPVSILWPLPVTLIGLFYALRSQRIPTWGAAGALLFASWFGALLPALLEWNTRVALQFASAPVVIGGLLFACAGAVARPHGPVPSGIAIGAAWVMADLLVQSANLGTTTIAHVFASDLLVLAPLVRVIGGAGIDFVLFATCGWLASGSPHRGVAGAIGFTTILVVLAQLPGEELESAAILNVAGLQPDLATSEVEAVNVSVVDRVRVERALDELTRTAARRHPGALIVWPEAGNRLANRALIRRHQLLVDAAAGSPVLITGREIDAEGNVFSSVSIFEEGAFGEEVRKAIPVPTAEAYLSRGRAGVLEVEDVTLGIAICYEAVFVRHLRQLADLDADVIIAVSDDASFGLTSLPYWHESVARLRAMEIGLPLFFSSNAGPTSAWLANGSKVASTGLNELDILYSALSLAKPADVLPISIRWTLPLLWALSGGCILYGLAARLRKRCTVTACGEDHRSASTEFRAAAASLLLALPLTMALGAAMPALVLMAVGFSKWEIWDDWQTRARSRPRWDENAPMFRQAYDKECGAYALAYAMTALGDQIRPQDVIDALAPPTAPGYSMLQLARYAERRGFAATGYQTTSVEDISLGGAVAIAHLRAGHFVVLLQVYDGNVLLFDPAIGARAVVPISRFEQLWSEKYLYVVPAGGSAS